MLAEYQDAPPLSCVHIFFVSHPFCSHTLRKPTGTEFALVAEYSRARERHAVAIQHLDAMRDRPAETRDGRRIRLSANVGLASDLRLVEQHGADGIGLFRTELPVLAHRGFPDENEQEQLDSMVKFQEEQIAATERLILDLEDELEGSRRTIRILDEQLREALGEEPE